jgi:hypothetical protein
MDRSASETMSKSKSKPEPIHTVPETARRKLVAAYRKQSLGDRFTPPERLEFARMADAWERTLPEYNIISVDGR